MMRTPSQPGPWDREIAQHTQHTQHTEGLGGATGRQPGKRETYCLGVCSTLGFSMEGPCARRPVPTGGCRERRKRTDRWAVWAVEERASSEAEQECPVYF